MIDNKAIVKDKEPVDLKEKGFEKNLQKLFNMSCKTMLINLTLTLLSFIFN